MVGGERGGERLSQLAYTVIEVKKPHDLPSGSWRIRETRGIIQSKAKVLKIGRSLPKNQEF